MEAKGEIIRTVLELAWSFPAESGSLTAPTTGCGGCCFGTSPGHGALASPGSPLPFASGSGYGRAPGARTSSVTAAAT
jgi:hypothetical protein